MASTDALMEEDVEFMSNVIEMFEEKERVRYESSVDVATKEMTVS